LNAGFNLLFVYTNIISPVIVCDSVVRLLKIVPFEGEFGQVVTKAYDKLQYVPLRSGQFDTVEINISTDTGKNVQFDFGKIVVTLHFRPRRLQFM